MYDCTLFCIDGQWLEPFQARTLDVIDPATGQAVGVISPGSPDDLDKAVR